MDVVHFLETAVKLGLLARTDNRGLGIQSLELYRHLRPDVTAAVSMPFTPGARKLYEYPERYPGAVPTKLKGTGLENYEEVRDALIGCDVVLTVETPYDFRLFDDLRSVGSRSAVVANREFLRWLLEPDLPRPDLFIAPSLWRIGDWPQPNVYLPHPVDRERLPFRLRTEARSFLHFAAPAMSDRAGTSLLLAAMDYSSAKDVELTIRAQFQQPQMYPRNRRDQRIRVITRDEENYWEAYGEADVLIAPRRYGGQSLPVCEAMSSGMPVVAIDREPERSLVPGETLVPGAVVRPISTPGGKVGLWKTDPRALARMIDSLAADPARVERLSRESDARASAMSWEALEPRWRSTLEELAS